MDHLIRKELLQAVPRTLSQTSVKFPLLPTPKEQYLMAANAANSSNRSDASVDGFRSALTRQVWNYAALAMSYIRMTVELMLTSYSMGISIGPMLSFSASYLRERYATITSSFTKKPVR